MPTSLNRTILREFVFPQLIGKVLNRRSRYTSNEVQMKIP